MLAAAFMWELPGLSTGRGRLPLHPRLCELICVVEVNGRDPIMTYTQMGT